MLSTNDQSATPSSETTRSRFENQPELERFADSTETARISLDEVYQASPSYINDDELRSATTDATNAAQESAPDVKVSLQSAEVISLFTERAGVVLLRHRGLRVAQQEEEFIGPLRKVS